MKTNKDHVSMEVLGQILENLTGYDITHASLVGRTWYQASVQWWRRNALCWSGIVHGHSSLNFSDDDIIKKTEKIRYSKNGDLAYFEQIDIDDADAYHDVMVIKTKGAKWSRSFVIPGNVLQVKSKARSFAVTETLELVYVNKATNEGIVSLMYLSLEGDKRSLEINLEMPFTIFDQDDGGEAACEIFRISPDAQVAAFVSSFGSSLAARDEDCHKEDELTTGQRTQSAFHQQQNTPRGRFYHLSTKTMISFHVPVRERVYADNDLTDTFSFQNKLFMGICRPCSYDEGGEFGNNNSLVFNDWNLHKHSVIRIWRTSDGHMISSIFLKRSIPELGTGLLNSLVVCFLFNAKLSFDGNLVVVIMRNTICMFDTFTGLLIRQSHNPCTELHRCSSGLSASRASQGLQRYSLVDCALSPNGALMARLYNIFTQARNQPVQGRHFSDDGYEFFFQAAVVEIVECNTGRKILSHTLRDISERACCISFVPDGRGLAVQSNDMSAYQFLYLVGASAAEEKVVHPPPLPREMEDQPSKQRRKQRSGKQTKIKDFFIILPREKY